jgi:cytochrome c biogenesis protein CcdA/thiol-disulfide isomerase/thioredoxin
MRHKTSVVVPNLRQKNGALRDFTLSSGAPSVVTLSRDAWTMRNVGLLLIFALLAGAGTAVSPCVLPVLPALLSAGATGGRRRPLGIVLGLALTFTLTVALLAKVVSGVGLGDGALRDIAIAVLVIFGIALAVPAWAARIEAPLSRLARFGPKDTGEGFGSGLAVGAALGFVYTPCAGPILAAVISVGATTGTTLRTFLIALAYAIGSAIVLLVLMVGGRRLIPRTLNVQRVLGAVLILTAVAMIARLDVRAEKAIAEHAPNANLTAGLEDSSAVGKRLNTLRPKAKFAERTAAGPRSKLRVLGTAPDFTGTQRWFNSQPLSLAKLRGRVVLIDFWTYTCINCIRTLPYLKAWDARYRKAGLTIVGVHSPEFSFEKDAGNVQNAIRSFGIRYPVVQDNNLATWQAWGNQYWPAEYLIDAQGRVRHVHFGEGEYRQSEDAIRSLLAERDGSLGGMAKPRDPFTISAQATPETYLGSARAQRWEPRNTSPASLPLSHFALGGNWHVTPEDATAGRGATIGAHVLARHVYLVLGGRGDVGVEVDGHRTKTVHVTRQRLYTLADFPRAGEHVLRLTVAPGISGFAFTFG